MMIEFIEGELDAASTGSVGVDTGGGADVGVEVIGDGDGVPAGVLEVADGVVWDGTGACDVAVPVSGPAPQTVKPVSC